MEFRILGPLEVLDNGGEISIRGRKLQALLALLLLHAPEVVSRDRLVDELWGDDPPATAAKTLQVHVSRLRRELGDIVVSLGGGYLIRIEPDALDLAHFERLVAEGRTAMAEKQPERASERLREALALWRGPPLAELADEPFAQIEIGRLEEERLDAVEERIEADLSLGRHSELIPELESLVARNPYRERLRALQMLALYQSGRQAEALAAYQDARRVLVDELGVEPGARLRELHAGVLAQDPALEPATPVRDSEVLPDRDEAPRRPRWVLAAVAVVVGLATLLFAVVSGGDDSPDSKPLSDDSHAVAVIDPATHRVTTAASVGTVPGPLAFEPKSRSIWVGNLQDKSVTRIDLDPVRTGRTIAIGERPLGLAAANGAVWVVSAPRAGPYVNARRIDARFDAAKPPVRVESLPRDPSASAAVDERSLWVAPSFGRLTRLDPVTGRKTAPGIETGSSTAVAAAAGQLWVADSLGGAVSRVDAATGIAKPIPVAGRPADIAVGADAIWVTLALEDEVARIDPETGSVRRTIHVGRRPAGIAVGAGAVWVANSGDGTVSRLDPRSGDVTDTIEVGASPQDVVVAAGRVWVSVRPRSGDVGSDAQGARSRWRSMTPLRSSTRRSDTIDASADVLLPTCAKLLAYPSEPGAAGTRVVPELAEALPVRSNGGRTYTFSLRRGYRFSPPSGERVTARSMKYTIERALNRRVKSPARAHLSDLAGGRAYAEGRARHISGVVARGNKLTLRLTRPSSNLEDRIALPFFCAVPVGTPSTSKGSTRSRLRGRTTSPRTCPSRRWCSRRDPGYAGSRPSRLDEIRITLNAGRKRTIAQVAAGKVDYTPIFENPAAARRLDARYGAESASAKAGRQRYFVKPMVEVDYIYFNTSRGPFRSARLRRAANYALDRRALAREGLWNGLPARPSDEYLPPNCARLP